MSPSLRRVRWSATIAGALPILAVNLAFWINVQEGLPGCFPYLDGCWSVSRAVRDGSGLWLFKLLILPAVAAMILTWWGLPARLSGPWTVRLGIAGALAALVYAGALGTEGEFYKWMRRYGVVFFFGLTGIAQLVVANRLWRTRAGRAGGGREGRDQSAADRAREHRVAVGDRIVNEPHARALELIAAKKEADLARILREWPDEGIRIMKGRWGPYATDGSRNARLPKETDPAALILEDVKELIEKAPLRGVKKKAAKKKAAKKKAAKRDAAIRLGADDGRQPQRVRDRANPPGQAAAANRITQLV